MGPDPDERRLRNEIRRHLLNQGSPRLQMFFILVLVGLLGLSVSAALRLVGVHSMGVRYPVAVVVAYAGFFGCLWMWVEWNRRGSTTPESDDGPSILDAVDPPAPDLHSLSGTPDVPIGGDLGDLFITIVVILLFVALVCCTVWLLYIAPELLADVLVDAVLLGALYRNVRHRQQDHWTIGALRATWIPFTLTAVALAIVGCTLQWLDPSLVTIGDVVRRYVIK